MNIFFLSLLSAASASVLRSELQHIVSETALTPQYSNKKKFYDLKLITDRRFHLENEQIVHSSPVTFDRECFQAHTTQSFLFVGCSLPKHCRNVVTYTADHSLLGFESVYCLSFHQSNSSDKIALYDIRFDKQNATFNTYHDFQPYSNHLTDLVPVSFFENFFIAKSGSLFYLLPRVCRERFTSDSHTIPSTFYLKADDSSFCISHNFFEDVDCTLDVGFESMSKLLAYYDYPLSYSGAPGAPLTGNGIDNTEYRSYEYYRQNSADFVYPVSLRNGGVYYANTKSPYPPKYIIFSKNSNAKVTTYCYPRISEYKPFLTTVLSSFLEELSSAFEKIFDTLLECSEKIASFFVSVLSHVLSKVIEKLLPYASPRFVPPALAFPVAYFCFSDVIKSVLFSILVFMCV